ncbi:hypothetical protein GOBAR_AA26355 [Gossypium barbadense]|uniref:Uncharacterized protein n=1 Tax=Gossypium barbadense TaxID=3634 RepID=A0A2P5WTB3_GOSBA|nr:hypothetical protein GOBAR_AA26355 [Gossypium barbadense]
MKELGGKLWTNVWFGSRHHPSVPTSSFEVEPTVGAEIEKPLISSAPAPRLGSDIKPKKIAQKSQAFFQPFKLHIFFSLPSTLQAPYVLQFSSTVQAPIFHNAMTVYPLSGGGNAPLQEHRSSLPPNIASSSLPTPSVKVMPTTNAEIKKPSMSSALFLRLGSDI